MAGLTTTRTIMVESPMENPQQQRCMSRRRTILLLFVMGFMVTFLKSAADDVLATKKNSVENLGLNVHQVKRAKALVTQVLRNTTTTAKEDNRRDSMLRGAVREVVQAVDPQPGEVHGTTNNSTNHTDGRNYAYAFVIGGCNPDKPTYKGFLYNILVSARVLKERGSQADVVAFFQLSYEYKAAETLPKEDIRALEKMNVHIRYIPPSPLESFYETVMNKFLVLTLTQYRRVILLDGDVMPLSNLDYLFELSDDNKFGPGNSTLRENLVVAGNMEPSNAGFFMVAPGEGEYEKISDIIQARYDKVRDREGDKFDVEEGWGHIIQEGDEWVTREKSGRKWDFLFAYSDQGLLFYWTKYVKKSVSMVFMEHVENWWPDPDGDVIKQQTLAQPFSEYSKPVLNSPVACTKFMCDFEHFTGGKKPWFQSPPADISKETKLSDGIHLWWYSLQQLDLEIGLNLDFENWSMTDQEPTLGTWAIPGDMYNAINQSSAAKNEIVRSDAANTGRNYAYAFVIGGCNPDTPTYKGFLYNILISAKLLKELGSQADIVAFFQMSYEYKAAQTLPKEDVQALEKMNVHIKYIPPSPLESFYETVMNKFLVLTLTQYRRVILLDGDVMPLSNLDYLFELSDDNKFGPGNSTLRENLVVAGTMEPSNAGFFMISPGEGEYEQLKTVIQARYDKVRDREGHKFDEEEGWGHVIQEGDEWVTRDKSGRKWDFLFAYSDQGLLFYWTKYVKKSVSMVFEKHVENWWSPGPDGDGLPLKQQTVPNLFSEYSKPLLRSPNACTKFMCDFEHFTGGAKPWHGVPPDDVSKETKLSDGIHLWWYSLKELDIEIGLDLDFGNWSMTNQSPPLGTWATKGAMNKHVEQVAAKNITDRSSLVWRGLGSKSSSSSSSCHSGPRLHAATPASMVPPPTSEPIRRLFVVTAFYRNATTRDRLPWPASGLPTRGSQSDPPPPPHTRVPAVRVGQGVTMIGSVRSTETGTHTFGRRRELGPARWSRQREIRGRRGRADRGTRVGDGCPQEGRHTVHTASVRSLGWNAVSQTAVPTTTLASIAIAIAHYHNDHSLQREQPPPQVVASPSRMKVETPQILWHADTEGRPAALASVSLTESGLDLDGSRRSPTYVLATAGHASEIHLWTVEFVAQTVADRATTTTTSAAATTTPVTPSPPVSVILSHTHTTKIDFLCALCRHDGPVSTVAFSPDGLHLASAGNHGSVVVWSVPVANRGRGNGRHFWSTLTSGGSSPGSGSSGSGGSGCSTTSSTTTSNHHHQNGEKKLSCRMRSLGDAVEDLSWAPDSRSLQAGTVDHCVVVLAVVSSTSSGGGGGSSHNSGNSSSGGTETTTTLSSPSSANAAGTAAPTASTTTTATTTTTTVTPTATTTPAPSSSLPEDDWKIVYRNTLHQHYVQGVAYDPLGVYLASQSSDRTVRLLQQLPPKSGKKSAVSDVSVKASRVLKHYTTTSSNSTVTEPPAAEAAEESTPTTTATVLPKKQSLFCAEMESFVRRLAWTPDGAHLICPAAVWHGQFATLVYQRHRWDTPCAVLGGLSKPSIAVRPNPCLWQLPEDQKENQAALGNTKTLPYRSIFAVLTWDSVIVYDTVHDTPLSVAQGLHYANLVDATWTKCGQHLVVCSTDGYISILSFAAGELGQVYVPPSSVSTTSSSSALSSDPKLPSLHALTMKDTNVSSSSNKSGSSSSSAMKAHHGPNAVVPTMALPPCEPGPSETVCPPSKRVKTAATESGASTTTESSDPRLLPASSAAKTVGHQRSLEEPPPAKKKKRIQPTFLSAA